MGVMIEKYYSDGVTAVVAASTRTGYAMEVGDGLNHQILYESRIGRLEENLETEKDVELDIAVRQLVLENIDAGRIDKFRLKLFGIRGDGGYWGNPRIVERRILEPEIYSDILISAIDGMGQMSKNGGKMPLGFYEELCDKAMEISLDSRVSSDKKNEIFHAVINMTMIGSQSSETMRKRLVASGVRSVDLINIDKGMVEKLAQVISVLYK